MCLQKFVTVKSRVHCTSGQCYPDRNACMFCNTAKHANNCNIEILCNIGCIWHAMQTGNIEKPFCKTIPIIRRHHWNLTLPSAKSTSIQYELHKTKAKISTRKNSWIIGCIWHAMPTGDKNQISPYISWPITQTSQKVQTFNKQLIYTVC